MPSSPCPCPRHGSLFHLSFSGYQEKTFFVFVFTFRFMFRYRRLSWCYSCLHRWQLWPSSLGVKQRLCPFWLQMLKLYLKIWSLGGGQGAGADHYEILELAKVVVIWDSVKKVKELLIRWPRRHLTACRRIRLSTRCVLRKWKESQKYVLIHHISLGFSFNISLWRLGLCLKHQLMWGHCSLDRMIEIMDNGVYFLQVGFLAKLACDYCSPSSNS